MTDFRLSLRTMDICLSAITRLILFHNNLSFYQRHDDVLSSFMRETDEVCEDKNAS